MWVNDKLYWTILDRVMNINILTAKHNCAGNEIVSLTNTVITSVASRDNLVWEIVPPVVKQPNIPKKKILMN